MLSYSQLIALSPIATPTECSQISLSSDAALRHRHNVVNFEQKMLLIPARDMAFFGIRNYLCAR